MSTDARRLLIDGLDQADVIGPFNWVNPMNVAVDAWFGGQAFDYVSARHDGYTRLRAPVVHARSVLYVRPARWVIVDQFTGRGPHVFRTHFNFHPDVTLLRDVDDTLVATADHDNVRLRLSFLMPNGLASVALHHDQQGAFSPGYGRWQSAPRAWTEVTATTPLTLVTIVALEDSAALRGAIRSRVVDGSAIVTAFHAAGGDGRRTGTSDSESRAQIPSHHGSGAVHGILGIWVQGFHC